MALSTANNAKSLVWNTAKTRHRVCALLWTLRHRIGFYWISTGKYFHRYRWVRFRRECIRSPFSQEASDIPILANLSILFLTPLYSSVQNAVDDKINFTQCTRRMHNPMSWTTSHYPLDSHTKPTKKKVEKSTRFQPDSVATLDIYFNAGTFITVFHFRANSITL
jgi:hypothetical protein